MTETEAAPAGGEAVSRTSREAQLREVVEAHVAKAKRVQSFEEAPLVRHDPYYLKEFSEYPAGVTDMEVRIRERESRMAPMVADVTLTKQRYATQMHRKKNAAREDSFFYRETGDETLTYQWRNGRWSQVASLFVVDTKEGRVDGEWRAVEPEPEEETVLPEGERGFFSRIFGGIFGR
jgi:hypothetical protein